MSAILLDDAAAWAKARRVSRALGSVCSPPTSLINTTNQGASNRRPARFGYITRDLDQFITWTKPVGGLARVWLAHPVSHSYTVQHVSSPAMSAGLREVAAPEGFARNQDVLQRGSPGFHHSEATSRRSSKCSYPRGHCCRAHQRCSR